MLASPPAPAGLEYQPFQIEGIRRMLKKGRLILADEMGLGKTVQAIGCINASPDTIKTVLIVCPKSMLPTWAHELERWLTRPLTVAVGGAGSEPLPECDILLMNYEMLSKRKPELLARGTFDALICDEAHYLKNPMAQRTKALLGNLLVWPKRGGKPPPPQDLPIEATHLWLLTGSPMLNHPIELWPLLRAVDHRARRMPSQTLSYFAFRKRYCDPQEHRSGHWNYTGVSNADELARAIEESGVMFRRTKANVLKDLPPKRREQLVFDDRGLLEHEENVLDKLLANRSANTPPSATGNQGGGAGGGRSDFDQIVSAIGGTPQQQENLRRLGFGGFSTLRRLTASSKVPP
jgi:SNF2 family DNA or RNA helicase